jgi:hypothetical protein
MFSVTQGLPTPGQDMSTSDVRAHLPVSISKQHFSFLLKKVLYKLQQLSSNLFEINPYVS